MWLEFITRDDKKPTLLHSIEKDHHKNIESFIEAAVDGTVNWPVDCFDLNSKRESDWIDNSNIPTWLSYSVGQIGFRTTLQDFPEDKMFTCAP